MAQYDTSLSRLLDKIAPLKKICSVDRPMSDWMTNDIRALKAIRRKNEVIWQKNPLFVNFENYLKIFITVKHAIDDNKTQTIHKRITDSNGDQKKLLNIIKPLLGRQILWIRSIFSAVCFNHYQSLCLINNFWGIYLQYNSFCSKSKGALILEHVSKIMADTCNNN